MTDRLDRWRRPGGQPPSGQPPQPPTGSNVLPFETPDDELEPRRKFDGTGREIYEAFRVSPWREEHLEIRPAKRVWQLPRFFDLEDIIPNERQGTEIVLMFPKYAVLIGGRNLQRLVYAIKAHRCAFMEAYDPDQFAPVEDEKAAFIDTIELKMRGNQKGGDEN